MDRRRVSFAATAHVRLFEKEEEEDLTNTSMNEDLFADNTLSFDLTTGTPIRKPPSTPTTQAITPLARRTPLLFGLSSAVASATPTLDRALSKSIDQSTTMDLDTFPKFTFSPFKSTPSKTPTAVLTSQIKRRPKVRESIAPFFRNTPRSQSTLRHSALDSPDLNALIAQSKNRDSLAAIFDVVRQENMDESLALDVEYTGVGMDMDNTDQVLMLDDESILLERDSEVAEEVQLDEHDSTIMIHGESTILQIEDSVVLEGASINMDISQIENVFDVSEDVDDTIEGPKGEEDTVGALLNIIRDDTVEEIEVDYNKSMLSMPNYSSSEEENISFGELEQLSTILPADFDQPIMSTPQKESVGVRTRSTAKSVRFTEILSRSSPSVSSDVVEDDESLIDSPIESPINSPIRPLYNSPVGNTPVLLGTRPLVMKSKSSLRKVMTINAVRSSPRLNKKTLINEEPCTPTAPMNKKIKVEKSPKRGTPYRTSIGRHLYSPKVLVEEDLMDEQHLSIMDTSNDLSIMDASLVEDGNDLLVEDRNYLAEDRNELILDTSLVEDRTTIKDLKTFLLEAQIEFFEHQSVAERVEYKTGSVIEALVSNLESENYRSGKEELDKIVKDLREEVQQFEENINFNVPLLFDEYQDGSAEERKLIQNSLKVTKLFCYEVAKQEWYSWKALTVDHLHYRLSAHSDKVSIKALLSRFVQFTKDTKEYLDQLELNVPLALEDLDSRTKELQEEQELLSNSKIAKVKKISLLREKILSLKKLNLSLDEDVCMSEKKVDLLQKRLSHSVSVCEDLVVFDPADLLALRSESKLLNILTKWKPQELNKRKQIWLYDNSVEVTFAKSVNISIKMDHLGEISVIKGIQSVFKVFDKRSCTTLTEMKCILRDVAVYWESIKELYRDAIQAAIFTSSPLKWDAKGLGFSTTFLNVAKKVHLKATFAVPAGSVYPNCRLEFDCEKSYGAVSETLKEKVGDTVDGPELVGRSFKLLNLIL